jgi:hypothetical protein
MTAGAHQRGLPAVFAPGGAGQPQRGAVGGHRQPLRPPQRGDPEVADRSPPRPSRGRPDPGLLVNMREGRGRLLRKTAFAGRSFADAEEITVAVRAATAGLNARARPWVWGRPAPPTRIPRHRFVYIL